MPNAPKKILSAIARAITWQSNSPVYPIMHGFHLHNLKTFEGCIAILKLLSSNRSYLFIKPKHYFTKKMLYKIDEQIKENDQDSPYKETLDRFYSVIYSNSSNASKAFSQSLFACSSCS